jgi:hypothetical protein
VQLFKVFITYNSILSISASNSRKIGKAKLYVLNEEQNSAEIEVGVGKKELWIGQKERRYLSGREFFFLLCL